MPPSGNHFSRAVPSLPSLTQLGEDTATQNTPLAPSVEKAYYRKCIELKRRLNEVEAANDEANLRRVRLDRAIMKMRLERAFLLEQLSKRMEQNNDGSEGSGDEGLATPPPDRPHRDKRRKPTNPSNNTANNPPNPPATSSQPPPANTNRGSSFQTPRANSGSTPMVQGPNGTLVPANAATESGEHLYLNPQELAAAQAGQRGNVYPLHPQQQPQQPHHSPYGQAPTPSAANGHAAADASEERGERGNQSSGATDEAMSAGPAGQELQNGERRGLAGSESLPPRETEDQGAGGFTAVNQ